MVFYKLRITNYGEREEIFWTQWIGVTTTIGIDIMPGADESLN